MTRAPGVLAAGLALITAGAVSAQVRTTVRAQPVYESYSFDPGFTFARVTEFAIPVGVDVSFGRRVDVTLSSGYVSLDVEPGGYDRVSGPIDTQLRLGLNLIPGRLIAVFTGTLPTGVNVDSAQAAVLQPIASDVIGFAIPTLGTGGSLGGGLVGAVAVGKFAVGAGATYTYPLTYQPFENSTTELAPGIEVRGRIGVEGPLARRTYLRFAGVFAARASDQFGVETSGVGHRYIGYAEIAQGVGRMQLTVYGFDVYRGTPSVEGAAVLPKGNLIAAGFRHAIPITRAASVAPRAEWRMSTMESDLSGSLRKIGTSVRFGVDLTQAVARGVLISAFGGGLIGDVRPVGGGDVPVKGWRAGLILNFAP